MTAWFIRIGSRARDEKKNRLLYRDLAENHSIIMIGYAINDDFTKIRNEIEIRSRLEACLHDRGIEVNKYQLDSRAGLIHFFINKIQKEEMVISPYEMTNANFRIGIVKSDCERVDSFFDNQDLQDIIDRHPDSNQEPVKPKPARRIEWKYENVPINQLPPLLQKGMENYEDELIATTNPLNINGTIDMSGLSAYAVNGGLSNSFTISMNL